MDDPDMIHVSPDQEKQLIGQTITSKTDIHVMLHVRCPVDFDALIVDCYVPPP